MWYTLFATLFFLGTTRTMNNLPEEPTTTQNSTQHLPATHLLTQSGDIASQMIDGIDRFLLNEMDATRLKREAEWSKIDRANPQNYQAVLAPLRKRLGYILGVRDNRLPANAPELLGTLDSPSLIAHSKTVEVHTARWHALTGLDSEGLLIRPRKGNIRGYIVAIPDCNQTPEEFVGIGSPDANSHGTLALAERGYVVLVPALIPRTDHPKNSGLTYREYLYRSAFELGRHLIGYEVQKILAAVDWFATKQTKIGVYGYGEGGMIALYAGALDTRIDATGVYGYLNDNRKFWEEPLDRNVFDRYTHFGDRELVQMLIPRAVVLKVSTNAPAEVLKGGRGAPATLNPIPSNAFDKSDTFLFSLAMYRVYGIDKGNDPNILDPATLDYALYPGAKPGVGPQPLTIIQPNKNAIGRTERLVQQVDDYNQILLTKSASIRDQYMKDLKTDSLANFKATVEPYRERFAKEIIGRFERPLLPPNPRTRLAYEAKNWKAYEVVLDVFPDVIAYGLLLIPNDIKPGEKRPVVVCQHGLEGRPQHTIGKEGFDYYKAFSAELANQGYITFAPQNIYIFEDRFRNLQRKANPLGKTLYSIMVPQHQQITDWLKTLSNVDSGRIGFYGLSYGGKTAMRVPPLVSNYCLAICSGDFNEWVWKNASTESPYSYSNKGEYEIFEFDLGMTFNYAEMAALIAPRPFMVERGHFDGVGSDEAVSYEYAKVRFLYQARLGIGDKTEIEYFVGPHTINAKKTFEFLDRYLKDRSVKN